MIARALLTIAAFANIAHAEPALSYKRVYVRAGIVRMMPTSASSEVALSNVHGPASLAISDGPIAGSGAAIDPVTTFAAIIGYRLPILHDRLSIETLVGAPIHVRFRATGSLATMSIAPQALGLPTGVPALGSELGEADAIPPMVTAVYRPIELGPLQPYAGAGVGFLVVRDARATNPILTAVTAPTFTVRPTAGVVVQTGFDLRVWRKIVARVDLKYVVFAPARATVEHIAVATPDLPLFGHADVGTATMNMTVNPLVLQISAGFDL